MANILCVWEMGSALGHLANLKPFVDQARAHGHQVTLALKELQNTHLFFPDASLARFQSPYLHRPPGRRYQPLRSFTQLLLQRFETTEELETLCLAWWSIFDAVRPDLVIYDYAPVAQLASHGAPWQKWAVGSGFLLPRTDLPYLGVFPRMPNSPRNVASLEEAEQHLLTLANQTLSRLGQPGLTRVRGLYEQLNRQWLLTCPELDHFGRRPGHTYLGKTTLSGGAAPSWPARPGPRVFGYLSNCAAIEPLLDQLERHGASVVIYSRDLPDALKERFPDMVFSHAPVDMHAVVEQADLVINMASHATALTAFLAGIPQVLLPRHQEQQFLAWRLVERGAGVAIPPRAVEVSREFRNAMGLVERGRQIRPPGLFEEFTGRRLKKAIDDAMMELASG
ncbi:MAG: glycosyltransferase [Pseudomonadota bacterium]